MMHKLSRMLLLLAFMGLPYISFQQRCCSIASLDTRPLEDCKLSDISPDGRFALLTDGADNIFILDIAGEYFKMIIHGASPANANNRVAKFNNSANSIIIGKNNEDKHWQVLELDYAKANFLSRAFIIPLFGAKSQNKVDIMVLDHLILFSRNSEETFYEHNTWWVTETKTLGPIKNINKLLKVTKEKKQEISLLADETESALYVIIRDSRSHSTFARVIKYRYSASNWVQEFDNLTIPVWNDDSQLQYVRYYLSDNGKSIASFSARYDYSSSQLYVTDILSRKRLFQIETKMVQPHLSDSLLVPFLCQNQPDSITFIHPDEIIERRSSRTYFRANSNELFNPLTKRQRNLALERIDSANFYFIDKQNGEAVPLHITNEKAVKSDGSKTRSLSGYKSFRLIENTPFNIISPAAVDPDLNEIYGRMSTCVVKGKYHDDERLNISYNVRDVDSIVMECDKHTIKMSAKKSSYPVDLNKMYNSFRERHWVAEEDSLFQFTSEMSLARLRYPLAHFVFHTVSANTFYFSWDLRNNRMVDGYKFNRPGRVIPLLFSTTFYSRTCLPVPREALKSGRSSGFIHMT